MEGSLKNETDNYQEKKPIVPEFATVNTKPISRRPIKFVL